VVEQVVVQDANQGTVRKSDLERVFKLGGKGKLEASAPSLWNQVVGSERAAPSPAAPSPAAPSPPPPATSK
ncbi:MAG TPA: hypothetical protein VIW29_21950, partial [Polyangiaceae bacterium]